jgi:hypothetical protein
MAISLIVVAAIHEISEADVRAAVKLAEELVGHIEARWKAMSQK